MKKLALLLFVSINSFVCFSQLTVTKKEGGSIVTNLGMGIKVNEGSSLKRELIIINDPNCPVQLNGVGINTSYSSSRYSFNPVGSITTTEPIVAYEIVHVIYNVFGEHMKSLSNSEVTDVNGQRDFSKYASWYASESDVKEYLICVSYVSNVRTMNGKVWRYSFKALKDQLSQLEISFDEGYVPKKDGEKEK